MEEQECPECGSEDIVLVSEDEDAEFYECEKCGHEWGE